MHTKHGSTLNTCSNDVRRYIERVTSRIRKIASEVTVRGDGCVAGKGRVVGVPKFHSWGKCTMPLTNINSDWMSNASSGQVASLGVIMDKVTLRCYLRATWKMLSATTSKSSLCRQLLYGNPLG